MGHRRGAWTTGQGHRRQGHPLREHLKDHKKEPGESRPIVTGCSGNTRGLSNSVSNFLESIANTIGNKFECISSEVMLANTKKADKEVMEMIENWKKKRLRKLNCKRCPYQEEQPTACQTARKKLMN